MVIKVYFGHKVLMYLVAPFHLVKVLGQVSGRDSLYPGIGIKALFAGHKAFKAYIAGGNIELPGRGEDFA